MGFGVAAVARPAQIKDAHGLGERAFDAGAGRVAGLKVVRLLPGAGGLERLILRLGPQGQAAWMDGRPCTLPTARAGQTGGAGKFHIDDGLPALIMARFPLHTALTAWTGGPAGLPVDGKVPQVEALPRPALPVLVLRGGPHQVDALLLAGHEMLRID